MSEECSDHECRDCKAKTIAQEVMTMMAKDDLSVSEAAIVARDIGYSILMQCPPEHKQELHDWIVSGIGKAVEQ